MPKEKSPAFQFYPKDFLSDEHVRIMSHTERGIYVTLLCMCWLEGSLPADVNQLARLVSLPAPRFMRLWNNSLHRRFMPGELGRLVHPRLEEERLKQDTHRQRQTDKGKSGSSKRWPDQKTNTSPTRAESDRSLQTNSDPSPAESENQLALVRAKSLTKTETTDACAIGRAMPSDGSSSSSPISSLQIKRRGPPPPDARSKHPAFRGQKLTVFDWQVEELTRMLDPHGETFDLHEWFFTLDKRCVDRGEIPPERDSGAWLKAQTLTEAQRRGLPLRMASADESDVPTGFAAIEARQARLRAAGFQK